MKDVTNLTTKLLEQDKTISDLKSQEHTFLEEISTLKDRISN
jgi:hypothetical protein